MCGVFGIFGHKDAARLTYLGLYALQHRGQESAGIVVSSGKSLTGVRDMGLVGKVFTKEQLEKLSSVGDMAVGHVRYSTTGISSIKNTQPFQVDYTRGSIAVAHNGNLVNAKELHTKLERKGTIFRSTMDSEIIVHLLARSRKRALKDAIIEAASLIKGAYTLVLLSQDKIFGLRDPQGFRPLCIGKLDGAYVLASETCALDLIQAEYIRDVEPGELVIIDRDGLTSVNFARNQKHAFCIFEFIYFARPDSNIFTKNIYKTRKRLGRLLTKESSVNADIAMPVPDSGNYAALGYSDESKIPFEMGLIRNHYVGRTFIQPSQFVRDFAVRVKLNPVRDIIKDKDIVIIEDSIVRGTTSKARVRTLRACGAKSVHMRVSCPPLKFPCKYGIDFPTRKELIASRRSVESIRKFLKLDSLAYLSLEGMLNAMFLDRKEFCTACFTGNYPVGFKKGCSKHALER